jgi:hypothetical protein
MKSTVKNKSKLPPEPHYRGGGRIPGSPFNKSPTQRKYVDYPPNKLRGLKPAWQPGQSGNPAGRPPLGKDIPGILRSIGELTGSPEAIKTLIRYFPEHKVKLLTLNNRDVVLWRAYLDAEYGDRYSRDFVAERTEGKVREYIDISSGDKELRQPPAIDLSQLTPEKLAFLRGIIKDVLHRKQDNEDAASANS